ncbi:MAG: sulfotransferase family 2 domain-containing protein [Gammaproteobacteria bacterium]
MIISHSRRFIFFSNPKTGSESVRALLEPFQEEEVRPFREHRDESRFYPHMSPGEARQAFRLRGLDFDGYYKFTFTRNPWARLVSLYEMVHGHAGSAFRVRRRMAALASTLTGASCDPYFCRWLAQTRPDGPGAGGPDEERWQRFGTYAFENYVADERGSEGVDYVVRLEGMAEERRAGRRPRDTGL